MFMMQCSSEASLPNANSVKNAFISQQQMSACRDNPGKLYLVGPEYHIFSQFADLASIPHMQASGYQWMGQMMGAAMYRCLVLKEQTTGLFPKWAIKDGSNIYLQMQVPKPIGSNSAPTLVLDTTNMAAADTGAHGFEVYNSAGTAITISSVTLIADKCGNTTIVKLACATDPGAGGNVGYAANPVGGFGVFSPPAAPLTPNGKNPLGMWGNLRDDDQTPALYSTPFGSTLWNWCAQFFIPYGI